MPLFNKISRVAIVDDHLIFMEGFKLLLSQYKFLNLVGEYILPEFLIKDLPVVDPEIVFLDIHTDGMKAWDAVKEIHKYNSTIKVVAITQFSEGRIVNKMLDAGICGYLVKTESKKSLPQLFLKMNEDEMYISSEADFNSKSGDLDLSYKEIRILQLLSADKKNKTVAKEIGISEKTLIRDISGIFQKLGVTTIAGAIAMAYKLKILP